MGEDHVAALVLNFRSLLTSALSAATASKKDNEAIIDELRRERQSLLLSLDEAGDSCAALQTEKSSLARQLITLQAEADSKERNYKDEVQRLVSEQAASAALIVKQKETIAELRASLDTARAQRGDGKSEGSAGSSSNSGGPGFLSSTSSAGASGNDLDSLLRAFLGQEAAAAAAPSPTSAPGSSPSSTSEASSNPSPASASAPNPRACYPAAVGPDLLLLLRHFKDKLSALAVAKAAAEGQLAKLASDVSALTTELKESKEASDKVVWDAQALLGVNERLSERVKAQAESLAALQKAELALQAELRREREALKAAQAAVEAKSATVTSLTASLAAAEEAASARADLVARAAESLGMQETSLSTLRGELLRLREAVDGNDAAVKALKAGHAAEMRAKEEEAQALLAEVAAARAAADKAAASSAAAESRLSGLQSSLAEAQLGRAQYHGQLVALEAAAALCWCKGKSQAAVIDAEAQTDKALYAHSPVATLAATYSPLQSELPHSSVTLAPHTPGAGLVTAVTNTSALTFSVHATPAADGAGVSYVTKAPLEGEVLTFAAAGTNDVSGFGGAIDVSAANGGEEEHVAVACESQEELDGAMTTAAVTTTITEGSGNGGDSAGASEEALVQQAMGAALQQLTSLGRAATAMTSLPLSLMMGSGAGDVLTSAVTSAASGSLLAMRSPQPARSASSRDAANRYSGARSSEEKEEEEGSDEMMASAAFTPPGQSGSAGVSYSDISSSYGSTILPSASGSAAHVASSDFSTGGSAAAITGTGGNAASVALGGSASGAGVSPSNMFSPRPRGGRVRASGGGRGSRRGGNSSATASDSGTSAGTAATAAAVVVRSPSALRPSGNEAGLKRKREGDDNQDGVEEEA